MGFLAPAAWHANISTPTHHPCKQPSLPLFHSSSPPPPPPTLFHRETSWSLGYMRVPLARGGCSTGAIVPYLQRATAARFSSALRGAVPAAEQLRHYHHNRSWRREQESVVVIMGATGTGKSKLSIDIATSFGGEVVNADKIQVYCGLDITTNKIPLPDRRGVPHHLLGDLDPADGELPTVGFRTLASKAIAGIAERRRIPVLAGGSNSFIHALVSDRYDPRADPYSLASRQQKFRYRCCFLWVDVEEGLLAEHLDQRVDEMVEGGMVEELKRYFATTAEGEHEGLGKAIGVPEFRDYFMKNERRGQYEGALVAIKENTRKLAETQVGKIKRLRERGWALHRVDATEAVSGRLCGAGHAPQDAAWDRDVLGPSVDAVRSFLGHHQQHHLPLPTPHLVR